jgi:hypothetical protein
MSVIQAVIKNVIAEVIQSVLGVSLQYILNPPRNSYALNEGDSFALPTLTIKGSETPTAATSNNVDVNTAGNYQVTWSGLIDSEGKSINDVIVNVSVIELDVTAPTFVLSPNQTSYTITEGDSFSLPTLTLTDDRDGTTTPAPTINTLDSNSAGNYVITWSNLSDSAGNTIADVTINVTVEAAAMPDTTPPTFSLSPIQTSYTINEGDVFFVPTLTLNDDVDGTSTPSPTSNNVDTSVAGNYEVTWSGLSDSAGNVIEDVTVSVEVAGVPAEVLIRLHKTANSFYSLSNNWVTTADYSIKCNIYISDVSAISTAAMIFGNTNNGNNCIFVRPDGSIEIRDTSGTSRSSGNVITSDKLHTIEYIVSSGSITGYLNNVEFLPPTSFGNISFNRIGVRQTNAYFFEGIIADVKLTDTTTPANSLEFKINKLTGNFELPANNVLSSEKITNGDFTNGTTGWTGASASSSVSVVNGELRAESSSTNGGAVQEITNLVIGKEYYLEATLRSDFGGIVRLIVSAESTLGGTLLISKSSNDGIIVVNEPFIATATTLYLGTINTVTSPSFTYFENGVSIKETKPYLTYENIPEDVRETFAVEGNKLIGSNNLVTNATVDTNSGTTYSGGVFTSDGTGGRFSTIFSLLNILQVGDTYQTEYTQVNNAAGVNGVRVRTGNDSSIDRTTASGVYIVSAPAVSSTDLYFQSNGDISFEGTIQVNICKRLIEVA